MHFVSHNKELSDSVIILREMVCERDENVLLMLSGDSYFVHILITNKLLPIPS